MILPAKPFKLRFTIRALLVLMTLFALVLAYHLNWIRQRRAAFSSGLVTVRAHTAQYWMQLPLAPDLPAMLMLFGEQPYAALWVNEKAGEDMTALASLFPEANLRRRDSSRRNLFSHSTPEIKAAKLANP